MIEFQQILLQKLLRTHADPLFLWRTLGTGEFCRDKEGKDDTRNPLLYYQNIPNHLSVHWPDAMHMAFTKAPGFMPPMLVPGSMSFDV